ncbi:MAG: hypothetical protein K4571_06750 [Deltaproteobacteria bacterium]
MLKYKICLPLTLVFLAIFAGAASGAPRHQAQSSPKQANQSSLRWVSLSTDSRDTVREIIRSEVDSRESFSTRQEEKNNLKSVEDEKEREDSDYKNTVIGANREFIRSKKRRDDATSKFQMASADLDESAKGIKTGRATIENLDGQINRYEQDIKAQQDSLKRWLQTEKQGEILVAVIYTRGFRDSAHSLEAKADIASAPLIAAHMGTYIQSFTKVINNVTTVDFIRATEEGTAKWNNEEPIRVELHKTDKGTSYLRLKRYELYPFQDSKAGKVKRPNGGAAYPAAIIHSRKDLEAFLTANQYAPGSYDLDRANKVIVNTVQNDAVAEEGLNDQVKTFQDRILNLQSKISAAKTERETQKNQLKRREESYYKLSLDVAAIREKKDLAERSFQQAQVALQEKKRIHESIIIKTALAATKGSQTPAEASAEVILDKLVEVKNDAKTQHSSSATEVTNFQVTAETARQSITDARITAIRLISFVNEGDSVRVKMAFRVRTVLEEQSAVEEPVKPDVQPSVKTQVEPAAVPTPEPRATAAIQPVPAQPKPVVPFKRTYRPLASQDALGCLFEIRSINTTQDGLRVLVEVINTHPEMRKVAFYDESFPRSWPRSRVHADAGNACDPAQAYVWQGAQKKLMMEIDSRGRGVEIPSQTSVTMELIFKSIPANVKTVGINLHPFIYYQNGRRETWQEFDLKMPDMRLRR